MINNIDFPIEISGPWYTTSEEEAIVKALRHCQYGDDKWFYNHNFENEFAHWHDRKYGLLTPNCTSAIHLLLKAIGIGPGDEIIVPDCTWIASAVNISHLGATPIFADIDPNDWCISPKSIINNITERTRAVIMVDLYGNMPKIDEINQICVDNHLWLIEDAAEALGSQYKGKRAGKFGVGSTFSFHRTKTLSMGEGGMLLTDNDIIYSLCKWYRDLCRKDGQTYFNDGIGYKYVVAPQQAALGYAQFKRVDQLIQKKQNFFHIYRDIFSDIPDIQLNTETEEVVNGAWSTTLVIGKSWNMNSKQAIEKLEKVNIPARPFFYPLSSLPAYNEYDYAHRNTTAYDISKRGIHLPGALNISLNQMLRIAHKIRETLFNKGL